MRKTQERGFCLKLNGLGAGFSGRLLTRRNYERQLSSTLNDPRSAGIIFPDPEQDTRPITSNLIGRVVFRELMYVAPSEAPQHFGLEIYGDFSRSEVAGCSGLDFDEAIRIPSLKTGTQGTPISCNHSLETCAMGRVRGVALSLC